MTDIIIRDNVWFTSEDDGAVDDALAGMAADLQERCPGMGPSGAQEVVCQLVLALTGQHRRGPMSAGRFAALVAEWRERRADGSFFTPRKLKAMSDDYRRISAARRVGYGVSKAQAGR